MKINLERLKKNIIDIGEIGRTNKGITRIAFSKEYFQALKKLKTLMLGQGLEVTVDKVGNIFGKRDGSKNLPSIMVGSHLDTVRNGGLLDGNLGVVAALECINVLKENNVSTNHPIEMVAFNAEEGSEMGGTFGSRVMMGQQDINEIDFGEKLQKYNININDIRDSKRNIEDIKAFLELHIEQGGILDKEGIPIGIVNGIVGITRYRIIIKGDANHAGTTPMDLRKDALVMASKLILKINDLSKKIGDPFVSTVGYIKANPGFVNVIPGEVELILEIRDLSNERIDFFIQSIKGYTEKIADYEFIFEALIDKPPVKTSKAIIKLIEDICKDKEIDYKIMTSGAGHDAKEIAKKIPTAMIFVPSKDGKSHCPEEYTEWKHIELGTQMLLETILNLDCNI